MANRVMPWQHLRAAEVLLHNLALTAPVTSLTRELSRGGMHACLLFIMMTSQ
jgi:hypothetical protein